MDGKSYLQEFLSQITTKFIKRIGNKKVLVTAKIYKNINIILLASIEIIIITMVLIYFLTAFSPKQAEMTGSDTT